MKQKGTDWITADGKSTQVKYIPKHIIMHEKIGQKIAAEAVILEFEIRKAKSHMIDLCKEALRVSDDKNQKGRFTFFTFDREYKIEYDIKEQSVRIFRSTIHNPRSKDYETILLNLNKVDIDVPQEPESVEILPPPPPADLFAESLENNK